MSTQEEDVVVYRVIYHVDRTEIQSWGRDTLDVAVEFCKKPKYPANFTDSFVAVDEWGHGKIVAATPDLTTHVGREYRTFKNEVR